MDNQPQIRIDEIRDSEFNETIDSVLAESL